LTKARNKQEFKERWVKWCKYFDKDRNSIHSQITRMVNDYAIWNLINGSRQYIEKDPNGKPLANGALHYSIDRWFAETQMIAIRRLIDTSNDVYSIMSVLNDMIDNVVWLTRKNIFELRNLPYDYAPLIEAERRYMDEQDEDVPSDIDSSSSRNLHTLIDILSRTSEEKRNKNDTIDMKFLTQLKENLSTQCEKFKNYANKHYAHAATEESREKVKIGDTKIVLREYESAHELLCRYADTIQVLLTGRSNKCLPISNPSLFTHWDKPIFQGKNPTILREIWNKYNEETNQWNCMSFDELRDMMNGLK
jgi:hypothetical protein